jgi:hypothetical protein
LDELSRVVDVIILKCFQLGSIPRQLSSGMARGRKASVNLATSRAIFDKEARRKALPLAADAELWGVNLLSRTQVAWKHDSRSLQTILRTVSAQFLVLRCEIAEMGVGDGA